MTDDEKIIQAVALGNRTHGAICRATRLEHRRVDRRVQALRRAGKLRVDKSTRPPQWHVVGP